MRSDPVGPVQGSAPLCARLLLDEPVLTLYTVGGTVTCMHCSLGWKLTRGGGGGEVSEGGDLCGYTTTLCATVRARIDNHVGFF